MGFGYREIFGLSGLDGLSLLKMKEFTESRKLRAMPGCIGGQVAVGTYSVTVRELFQLMHLGNRKSCRHCSRNLLPGHRYEIYRYMYSEASYDKMAG